MLFILIEQSSVQTEVYKGPGSFFFYKCDWKLENNSEKGAIKLKVGGEQLKKVFFGSFPNALTSINEEETKLDIFKWFLSITRSCLSKIPCYVHFYCSLNCLIRRDLLCTNNYIKMNGHDKSFGPIFFLKREKEDHDINQICWKIIFFSLQQLETHQLLQAVAWS